MPVFDVGIIVQNKYDTIAQFFFIRAQRTNEVTQTLGQHGDSAIYQIDTGSTLFSLTVDDTAFGDIMAHIGNMHAYLPVLVLLTDRERIVKVLGIFGVDGASEHIAEVLTTGNFFFRNLSTNLLGSVLYTFRILIG